MKASGLGLFNRTELEEMLTAAFTLCKVDPSLTSQDLEKLIARAKAAATLKPATKRRTYRTAVDYDVLGHVIYIWQRTPNYLDASGQPVPIPARGPSPSIEALFRAVKRSKYFEQGLRHLARLKRIRRLSSGRYVPCSEVTIVDGLPPEFAKLLSQTVNRLMTTVMQNTAQAHGRSLRLIERVTAVPDLPAKQVRAFKLFAREQGGALINTMNEWLESRRGDRKARAPGGVRNLTAGLHVFAFVEKND